MSGHHRSINWRGASNNYCSCSSDRRNGGSIRYNRSNNCHCGGTARCDRRGESSNSCCCCRDNSTELCGSSNRRGFRTDVAR